MFACEAGKKFYIYCGKFSKTQANRTRYHWSRGILTSSLAYTCDWWPSVSAAVFREGLQTPKGYWAPKACNIFSFCTLLYGKLRRTNWNGAEDAKNFWRFWKVSVFLLERYQISHVFKNSGGLGGTPAPFMSSVEVEEVSAPNFFKLIFNILRSFTFGTKIRGAGVGGIFPLSPSADTTVFGRYNKCLVDIINVW